MVGPEEDDGIVGVAQDLRIGPGRHRAGVRVSSMGHEEGQGRMGGRRHGLARLAKEGPDHLLQGPGILGVELASHRRRPDRAPRPRKRGFRRGGRGPGCGEGRRRGRGIASHGQRHEDHPEPMPRASAAPHSLSPSSHPASEIVRQPAGVVKRGRGDHGPHPRTAVRRAGVRPLQQRRPRRPGEATQRDLGVPAPVCYNAVRTGRGEALCV